VAATPQRIPMFIGDRWDDFELRPLVNVSQSTFAFVFFELR